MASGFLSKVFGDHIACGCRPPLGMCGTYDPEAVGVEVFLPDDDEVQVKFCEPCLKVWYEHGCGNCTCGPYNLCHLCQGSTVQPAADSV